MLPYNAMKQKKHKDDDGCPACQIKGRIQALCAAVQKQQNDREQDEWDDLHCGTGASPCLVNITVQFGPVYARLVCTYKHGGQDSVCGWVRLSDGAILYGPWRGPTTKHVRGSVLSADFGLSAFGRYAVKTLR